MLFVKAQRDADGKPSGDGEAVRVTKRPKREATNLPRVSDAMIRVVRDRFLLDLARSGFTPRQIACLNVEIASAIMRVTSKRHVTRRINEICEQMGVEPPWHAT